MKKTWPPGDLKYSVFQLNCLPLVKLNQKPEGKEAHILQSKKSASPGDRKGRGGERIVMRL